MHGVTTALVVYQLACLAFPNLVRHKPQYYWSILFIGLIIILDAVATIFGERNPVTVLCYVFAAFFQLAAVGLLMLSTGGLTPGELAGEFKNAYEVMRRGEDTKEVIVPLSGQPATPREHRRASADDSPAVVYRIDDPAPQPPIPVEDAPRNP